MASQTVFADKDRQAAGALDPAMLAKGLLGQITATLMLVLDMVKDITNLGWADRTLSWFRIDRDC